MVFSHIVYIFWQVKAGDIRFLASTSFLLVRKDWSSEIRLHGFKMLQVYSLLQLISTDELFVAGNAGVFFAN